MVKNPEILKQFELDIDSKIGHSFEEKIKIFEGMLEFVCAVDKNRNLLDGLQEKIELIRRFQNAVKGL